MALYIVKKRKKTDWWPQVPWSLSPSLSLCKLLRISVTSLFNLWKTTFCLHHWWGNICCPFVYKVCRLSSFDYFLILVYWWKNWRNTSHKKRRSGIQHIINARTHGSKIYKKVLIHLRRDVLPFTLAPLLCLWCPIAIHRKARWCPSQYIHPRQKSLSDCESTGH